MKDRKTKERGKANGIGSIEESQFQRIKNERRIEKRKNEEID